jgi:creatinine amidohydrolase
MYALGSLTTDELRVWLTRTPNAILVPLGSCEPHGPHLPLDTDMRISQRAAELACERLRAVGVAALIAPAVAYGVTDFAGGFAGAISIAPAVLTELLRGIAAGFLAGGASHVCFVNNHLEPAHDAAVRAAVVGNVHASVACPLSRRWARTLSAEFKSGACHAGRYETSLVLAQDAKAVRVSYLQLHAETISLSAGIASGKSTFRELGMDHAYTGAPAEATADEGRELYERLAHMVETEVLEGLLQSTTAMPQETPTGSSTGA